MVSLRCKMKVKEELQKLNVPYSIVDLGSIETIEELTAEQLSLLKANLLLSGLEIVEDKRSVLVEKIKSVIQEMIDRPDDDMHLNYSDYISKKTKHDYTYLANIFSEVKGITIQQYIINLKIEKVKELLLYGELNLTEIAHTMHYSSVAHLSNQFKKTTGLSPTFYKNLQVKKRIPLESL